MGVDLSVSFQVHGTHDIPISESLYLSNRTRYAYCQKEHDNEEWDRCCRMLTRIKATTKGTIGWRIVLVETPDEEVDKTANYAPDDVLRKMSALVDQVRNLDRCLLLIVKIFMLRIPASRQAKALFCVLSSRRRAKP